MIIFVFLRTVIFAVVQKQLESLSYIELDGHSFPQHMEKDLSRIKLPREEANNTKSRELGSSKNKFSRELSLLCLGSPFVPFSHLNGFSPFDTVINN